MPRLRPTLKRQVTDPQDQKNRAPSSRPPWPLWLVILAVLALCALLVLLGQPLIGLAEVLAGLAAVLVAAGKLK